MRYARRDVWFGVLLFAAAICGCSKGEEAATVATSSPAGPEPSQKSVATKSTPVVSSAVVPAAASQPVVQADPIVVLHTSAGDLYVRLYEKQAPQTVSNFLGYVRSGFYNGTIFHQVEPGFVAMGGGFDERKQPKSARYPIPNEATNGLKNVRGSLAMARDPADPHSATSPFFFNLADNAKLDHRGPAADQFGYCVFGQVIDGLEGLDKLSSAAGQTIVVKTMQVTLMPRDDQVRPAAHQASNGP